jgi:DNA processing protein
MTKNPSPEKTIIRIPGAVHQINSRSLSRFLAVESKVSKLDLSSIAFNGWHKFKGSSFRYTQEHILLPETLYFIGQKPEVLNLPLVVSFCGSETPTVRGFQLTELLAQIVSRTGLVISGGVHGIDMAAHLGALDGGGPTIAVVANSAEAGIHPYVPQRKFIQDGILSSGGGILSEYCTDLEDRRERLLARDRIISGLSDMVVVIEASENSASLDTAKRAHLQGKVVLAVDWTKFPGLESERPKMAGNRQLFELGIARSFPERPVSDLSDPFLEDRFVELLAAITAQSAELLRSDESSR